MEKEIPVYINYGPGRFMPMFQQFGQFLQTVPLDAFKVTKNSAPVGIIVSPRNNSGIPFCNIALALLYAAKGYPVTIIWDDLDFLEPDWELQIRCVDLLVKAISDHSCINYLQLSTLPEASITESDIACLQELATQNAVWNVRNLVPSEELEAYTALSFNAMSRNAGRIKYLYATHRFDHCVHQSLVNNNGGLHKYFANLHQQRMGCFDVADERGLIGLNDVHGYFYDLLPIADPASSCYLFENQAYADAALRLAKNLFNLRLHGKDEYNTQPLPESVQKAEKYDIVIPMNIFWDAAALGRSRIFDSPYDWLVNALSYILFETKHSVVLRQHPHERNFQNQFETGALLGDALVSRFRGHPRFRFISCTEEINTYHLIEQAKMVLPFTSTIGIEAALMGKRVVVASNVYYADQPFVHKSTSVEDYFDQIKRCEPAALSEDAMTKGWLLYFLATQTPFMAVPFGLNPSDVEQWTAGGFSTLHAESTMQMAIDCMASNTPFAYKNGERILKQAVTQKEHHNELDLAHHS